MQPSDRSTRRLAPKTIQPKHAILSGLRRFARDRRALAIPVLLCAAQAHGAPQAVPVTAYTIVPRDIAVLRSGLGTVTPINQVDVKTRVDGQIETLSFSEGQEVKAGDVLAQLDPRLYQAQLAQAQATLQKDRAQLGNAQKDESRAARLSSSGAGTAQAMDTSRAQVAVDQAIVLGDEAAVKTAELNLAFTTIRAPIAGRAGLKQADTGAIIHASDTTGVVTITQMAPIAVTFSLPQAVLRALVGGQDKAPLPVAVDALDGSGHLADGTVAVIGSQVDSTTGTVKIKANFANPTHTLWPGQLVTAHVTLRTDRAVVAVPDPAIQNGQNGPYVYVIAPSQKARLVPVRTGPASGGYTEILSGLQARVTVVVTGQSRLTNGTAVQVVPPDASAQQIASVGQ